MWAWNIYTVRSDYQKFGIHASSYEGRKKWLSIKKDGFNSTSMNAKSRWNLIIHEFGFVNSPQIGFKQIFTNHQPEAGANYDEAPYNFIRTLIGNMTKKVNENEYRIIENLNIKAALSSCWPLNCNNENEANDEEDKNDEDIKNNTKKKQSKKHKVNQEWDEEFEKSKFKFVPNQLSEFDQSSVYSFKSNRHVTNTFDILDLVKSKMFYAQKYYLSGSSEVSLWQMVFSRKTRFSTEIAYLTKTFLESDDTELPCIPGFITCATE